MIGLLHDFGKYSHSFQEYLRRMSLDQDTEQPDPERGKIDHSTAGAQTIWRTLKQQGTLQGVVGELLAICVASHHSGLIDCITPGGFDNLSRRMNKPDPESHFDEVRGAADESVTLAYTQYGTEFASVVLEHHSNLTPLHQTWKSKILSENWDAPVVFTTAVQLLEGLFGSGTRAVRRMHQMARSVLIFDETQTRCGFTRTSPRSRRGPKSRSCWEHTSRMR